MEAKFWLERWLKNQIGFHQRNYNAWLVKHWPTLQLQQGDRVFVPLCGKSLDMRWLAEQGFEVVGVELSRVAVESFFGELDEPYDVTRDGGLSRYTGEHAGSPATIYCGDFFALTANELGGTRAMYDRGALVALPPEMRRRYVDHMLRVVPEHTSILLVTLEYDQKLVSGPPFAVYPEEVEALYGQRCDVERIDGLVSGDVPPHFRAQGIERAGESIYLITKHS